MQNTQVPPALAGRVIGVFIAGAHLRGVPPAPVPHFGVAGVHFVLDGTPFQVISGEMHYARVPREYWRDRLGMARAMGLDTASNYVFWNGHEPMHGTYQFRKNPEVQQTLYVPGPGLKPEGKEIVVFAGKPERNPVLRAPRHRVLDNLCEPRPSLKKPPPN